MTNDTYECAACHETFYNGWSNEDAKKEHKELYGDFAFKDKIEVICDDCFVQYKKWHDNLTPEQHAEIQKQAELNQE